MEYTVGPILLRIEILQDLISYRDIPMYIYMYISYTCYVRCMSIYMLSDPNYYAFRI